MCLASFDEHPVCGVRCLNVELLRAEQTRGQGPVQAVWMLSGHWAELWALPPPVGPGPPSLQRLHIQLAAALGTPVVVSRSAGPRPAPYIQTRNAKDDCFCIFSQNVFCSFDCLVGARIFSAKKVRSAAGMRTRLEGLQTPVASPLLWLLVPAHVDGLLGDQPLIHSADW